MKDKRSALKSSEWGLFFRKLVTVANIFPPADESALVPGGGRRGRPTLPVI